ncbi:MAG: A/G-specific adenine glycosylase, partial [Prevotellaceae bacterium]|nr:A/G-specific adenine glycosylase [Prevotellaceae bacterium]
MDFTAELLEWYRVHRRYLPWKQTGDPYKIWLSEIILQQTRVEQGEPYYRQFTERFPTVQALAAAPLDEVLRLWQGLGYYSRARHLHHTAQQIVAEHGGRFPRSREALLKLKGIGPYTAAAIASFAFKEAVPAIDGNGYRILSRVFGIEEPADTDAGKKLFAEIAAELIPAAHPDDFNQALMDFGSLVCTPRPLCAGCP